jgi:hypothetical protein
VYVWAKNLASPCCYLLDKDDDASNEEEPPARRSLLPLSDNVRESLRRGTRCKIRGKSSEPPRDGGSYCDIHQDQEFEGNEDEDYDFDGAY